MPDRSNADAAPCADGAVVVRNDRTAARVVNGRALVVVINRNQLHTLNESGSFLWDNCEGKTLSELGALLQQKYGIDPDRARADAEAFLTSMVGVDALRMEER